jgi:hypothetical protein
MKEKFKKKKDIDLIYSSVKYLSLQFTTITNIINKEKRKNIENYLEIIFNKYYFELDFDRLKVEFFKRKL